MTTSVSSYGAAAQVASLTRQYTNSGSYDTTTNPTLSTVEGWIDDVSAFLNVNLAKAGFTIPVTQTTAKQTLASLVVEAVAELCKEAHKTGRFATQTAIERGVSPMRVIRNEMTAWVEENAAGFKALGAACAADDQRSNTLSAGVISFDFVEHDDWTSTVPE